MTDLQYLPDEGNEWFPLIDEACHVIGKATRRYCHGGSMALHAVVHLHVVDHEGRLYLQKRSMKKDIQPGKWDTAVGGHIDYGEQIADALIREAREELGLTIKAADTQELFQYIWQSEREREMVNAFALCYEGPFAPDHDEVDEGRFWTLAELEAQLGKGVFTPQFEQELPKLLVALKR